MGGGHSTPARPDAHGLVSVRVTATDDLPDRATVRVTVLDVTWADAAARQVAARELHPVAGRVARVDLPAPPAAGGRRYEVRVHVDVDGSGEVAPGDWVSTVAHPVPIGGGAVVVPLTRA